MGPTAGCPRGPGVTVTGHDNLGMRQWLRPEGRPQTPGQGSSTSTALTGPGTGTSSLGDSGQPCLALPSLACLASCH